MSVCSGCLVLSLDFVLAKLWVGRCLWPGLAIIRYCCLGCTTTASKGCPMLLGIYALMLFWRLLGCEEFLLMLWEFDVAATFATAMLVAIFGTIWGESSYGISVTTWSF